LNSAFVAILISQRKIIIIKQGLARNKAKDKIMIIILLSAMLDGFVDVCCCCR
jgi:hypothetical protein